MYEKLIFFVCVCLQSGGPPSRPQYVKRLPMLEESGEGESSNALRAPLTLANRRESRVLEDIGSTNVLDLRPLEGGRTRYPYPPLRDACREYGHEEENLRPLMNRENVPRAAELLEPLESVPLDTELLSRIITEEEERERFDAFVCVCVYIFFF